MQNTLENLSGLERRLTMAVPVAEIDKQVDERLKKIARTVRMAGFRPGKVPMKVVAQQYGPGHFGQDGPVSMTVVIDHGDDPVAA